MKCKKYRDHDQSLNFFEKSLRSGASRRKALPELARRASGAIQQVQAHPGISTKVKSWLDDSIKPLNELADCRVNAGHVKHAFTLAFHFLRKKATYEDAVRETLKLGGDTDTNACIVGGMMGALHGLSAIPTYMIDPVMKFDPTTHDAKKNLMGYRRPAAYRANNLFSGGSPSGTPQ
jgi:ADP-ribosylglycohydrolase